MSKKELSKYISYFILAVLVIVVYKTFDSLGEVFGYLGKFFKLLLPILVAFGIAFVLHPLCRKLENLYRKLKIKKITHHCRGFAVATVYLVALAFLALFFYILVPMIFGSITDLVQQMPTIVDNIGKYLYSINIAGYDLSPLLDKLTVEEIVNRFNLMDIGMYVDSITGFSKGIFNVILSIIISIYILLDRGGFLHTGKRIIDLILPDKAEAIFFKYLNHSFNIMYKYINCQLLDMCIVFFLAFISLMILRVDYAPVLAVFIGVFNLIPYFGAIIACTVTALLTVFTTGALSKGIVVAVVLIILQQIDANVIQPKLVRETLMVKPFWVLCGITIGGGILGIWGILLAVPIMALIKTIFEDCYDYYISTKKEHQKETPSKPVTKTN